MSKVTFDALAVAFLINFQIQCRRQCLSAFYLIRYFLNKHVSLNSAIIFVNKSNLNDLKCVVKNKEHTIYNG